MDHQYVAVHIIDIPYGTDKKYVYFAPHDLRDEIKIGTVVIVPFGHRNRIVSAVVVELLEKSSYSYTKNINDIMRYPFDVPEDLIKTCSFMKERFFCTFGSAFKAVIPPGVNLETEITYTVKNDDSAMLSVPGEHIMNFIASKGICTERALLDEFGDECKPFLIEMCKSGFIEKGSRVLEKLNELNRYTYSLTVSNEEADSLANFGKALTEKQRGLLQFLINYPSATIREIEEIGGYGTSIVNALVKKGLVEKRETVINRDAYDFSDVEPEGDYTLSDEQNNVIKGLCELADSNDAKAALLFGVTGSGKTRIITETIKHVIAQGKQAIILLPEIGLTSQAVRTYAAAFGNRLAVIHSMLSIGQRTDTYRKICSGEVDVVVGTRSAIFAPLNNIGIIAIDEEQASTYKSESTPKYNAIDIARFRCASSSALMLLASATPSVESYYKAQKGVYTLFKLENRFGGAKLPEVIIEDMRDDSAKGSNKLIGTRLAKELSAAKENGKQAILFVNRRGHNSHIMCKECGYVYTCPNCSVALTNHTYEGLYKGDNRLRCHYCGFSVTAPKVCDICHSDKIGYSGFGTQKLQTELELDFPKLKCLRMDSDTTSGKFSHDNIIENFAAGQSDVLVGTQMISKGFDFPNVRIAGAVAIDSSLYMNDFRAGERTFSLITQLVGRAGRADGDGVAILQTFNPENETLKLAATQNYEKFFESEIVLRKAVLFPPFCSIAVFTFSSANEDECKRFAEHFESILFSEHSKRFNDLKILRYGPYRHDLYKVMGKYRQRTIIKYKDNARAREYLKAIYTEGLKDAPSTVRLDLDTNPFIV